MIEDDNMTESTKISVRMGDKELEQLDAFAKNNGLNRKTALNLFVKFAVQFLQQSEVNAARFDRIESHLKGMQKANYKALVYLATATEADKPRYEKAEAAASRNVSEIFGEAGK